MLPFCKLSYQLTNLEGLMATYYSNEIFVLVLKIMLDGEPYAVEASEFVKRVKPRCICTLSCRLLTGTVSKNLQVY